MTCYAIPTLAALIHFGLRKKNPSKYDGKHARVLNQLLAGAAVFGVIDHAWNGELFLVGPNILQDLLLGLTITVGIFGISAVSVLVEKARAKSSVRA